MSKVILPGGNGTSHSPMDGGLPDTGTDGTPLDNIPNLDEDSDDGGLPTPTANDDNDTDDITSIEIDGNSYNLNENGDALNADGTVAYDKNTIDGFEAGDENLVTIDGESFTLDDDGNALNDAGEIVHKAEDLEEEDEVLDIDGVEYTVDENGNAVDSEGTIKYTADELANFDVDNSTTVESLMELSQIVPYGEDGEPMKYEETDEGQRRYIEDVYQAGGLDKAQEILDTRHSQYPLIKQASDYIIANGSLDGFSDSQYEERVITNDTKEEILVTAIREARLLKGDSETEVARMVSWAKSDNKLYEIAKESQEYIDSVSTQQRDDTASKAHAREEAQKEADVNYYNNINDMLDKGVVTIDNTDYRIPKILEVKDESGRIRTVDRSALLEYGTEMLQWEMADGSLQNATRYQIDLYNNKQTRTIGNQLLDMLEMFTGTGNKVLLDSVVQDREASRTVKKLKTNSKRRISQRQTNQNNTGKIILPGNIN